MSKTVRIFYAHAKGMSDKDIDDRARTLKWLAQATFPYTTV